MSQPANNRQTMSVFLLKEDSTPESTLKKEHELTPYHEYDGWKYCTKNISSHPTDWAKYLNLKATKSSASTVLFILANIGNQNKKRWFAICFGYGFNLLDKQFVVSDFGLRCALNMLDKDKIKSSGIIEPSELSKKRSTQTTNNSTLIGHDFKGYENILKNITGKVKQTYEHLSRIVTASDASVKISIKKPASQLEDVCKELWDIYKETACETDFPEVFFIRPVKEAIIINELDKELITAFNNKSDLLFLDIPEFIDFQDIDKFRISLKNRKSYLFNFLEFEDVYNTLNKPTATIDKLNTWHIISIDKNGNEKKPYRFYNCLVFDTVYNGEEYHLTDGQWYSLEPTFLKKMQTELASTKKCTINNLNIPAFTSADKDEADYNEKLAKKLNAILMDKKNIPTGGQYDKMELCDVLVDSPQGKNTFIHVKRYHASASNLSHLFAQGDNSLTLLNSKDKKFLKGIKKHISNFDENKEAIVYFVIVDIKNDTIPLFSRISLNRAIESITAKRAEVKWCVVKN